MRNTTVLIIIRNDFDNIRRCIDSLRWFGNLENISVVLVDNASTDGLREWASLQQDITYIYMDEGYTCNARIINLVLKELNIKDDLLVINGSYLIVPFCLSNLKKMLYEKKETGAVGPLCNCFRDIQNIGDGIQAFEAAVEASHATEGKIKRTLSLNVGAIMYKYEALKAVGDFDETLTEADSTVLDYGLRMLLKGYEAYICEDAYIWSDRPVYTMTGYYGENRPDMAILYKKWGMRYFNTLCDINMLNYIERTVHENFNVLEIGCDCGANLLEIKNRYPHAKVYGIEINECAARIAKTFAEVMIANIESEELPYENNTFDYILFGNVLEHLEKPEGAIGKVRRLLKPGGKILAEIPNLMHISVLEDLLQGNFTYCNTGLLDRTHIHFFTFNEIVKLFLENGYHLNMGRVCMPVTDGQTCLINSLLALRTGAERHMFDTFQYIVIAENAL